MGEIRLTPATRELLKRLHAEAVQRTLAAEATALGRMRQPVDEASAQLLVQVASAPSDSAATRRALFAALASLSPALHAAFFDATRTARGDARNLALGQVALELGATRAGAEAIGLPPPPAIPPTTAETTDIDVGMSQQAASSMTAVWGSAALAAFYAWRRNEEPQQKLIRRLKALPETVAPRVAMHASTQAVDAYAEARTASWRVVAGSAQRLGPYRSPALPAPPDRPEPEPELDDEEPGLPFGWRHGAFDVWSAILDRRTCPVCSRLDGTMVPVGKPFPGVGRPPAHPLCRCVVVTLFVPEAVQGRLPGIQIDYGALKADVADYMRNARSRDVVGKRHALEYVRTALSPAGGMRSTGQMSSPETLLRKMRDKRGYAEHRKPRAPKLPKLPP